MKRLLLSLWPGWRWLGAAGCAVAVLHILATLATPRLAPAQAFARLSAGATIHAFTLLPPVSPGSQKLPFMAADALYAICPFDTQKGPIAVTATLPGPGWALAIFTPDGENFYVAVAQPGNPTTLSLLLMATDDRFNGLTPQAKGLVPRDSAQLKVPADRGFVLLRAPDQGQAFRPQNVATLQSATCGPQAP